MAKRVWLDRSVLAAAELFFLVFAGAASAVTLFSNGEDYLKSSGEYKSGYLAGATDMLTALQDAGFLKEGPFSAEAAKVVQCKDGKNLKDIHEIYLKYLEANPQNAKNIAASTIYFALKDACKI
jgi:hypothetical protein